MENRSHALAAGIFVLLLALAAAFGLWWLGGKRELTDTYLLETRKNVTGLNVQAQVRYRGIRAGKVEAIYPDEADPRVILVRISLDSRYRLTRGTTAQLGYQGVTGLAYVQIEDEGRNSQLLEEKDGEPPRIALKPTLFDTLGEKAGDIVGQVGELAVRLNALLDQKNSRNIAMTLENLAAASAGFSEVPQLVAAMRAALSDGNLKRLSAILAHLEKTAGEAAPLTVEMREMVKSMNALARKVDHLADTTGTELAGSTLPRANALLLELTENARQLGRLLENLEDNPQTLVFGRGNPVPGPGEAGFARPTP
ncbi:MAG: MCE family protein [Rhodocyclaceae bacterium]|nr:MCE family protein [Rhodocyclaceae bacterium]